MVRRDPRASPTSCPCLVRLPHGRLAQRFCVRLRFEAGDSWTRNHDFTYEMRRNRAVIRFCSRVTLRVRVQELAEPCFLQREGKRQNDRSRNQLVLPKQPNVQQAISARKTYLPHTGADRRRPRTHVRHLSYRRRVIYKLVSSKMYSTHLQPRSRSATDISMTPFCNCGPCPPPCSRPPCNTQARKAFGLHPKAEGGCLPQKWALIGTPIHTNYIPHTK